MDNKIALCVTTYKKPEALKGWLASVPNFAPPGLVKWINVADDDDGSAAEVANAFGSDENYGFDVSYTTGPNRGIAINKNRNIHWFLNAPQVQDCEWLCLSDDDIVFTQAAEHPRYLAEALIHGCRVSNLKHLTGYVTSAPDPLTGNPFFTQFPPLRQNQFVVHCAGTQGILLFFHRSVVEKVKYFDTDWKSNYGYEHAAYSRRVNASEGLFCGLFPILRNCDRYFHCQGIANNYSADPGPNAKIYEKKREQFDKGLDLIVRNPGF